MNAIDLVVDGVESSNSFLIGFKVVVILLSIHFCSFSKIRAFFSESINSDFQDDYLYADRDNTRFKCNPETVFGGNGSSLEYLGVDSAFYEDYYELKSDFGWQDLISLTYNLANNPLTLLV